MKEELRAVGAFCLRVMKKNLFKQMALIAVIALAATQARAAKVTIDGISYRLYASEDYQTLTATVSGYSGTPTNMEIPSAVVYEGLTFTVTGIWDAFRDCTSLTSVNIPSSVVVIGNNAFNGCTSLTSVNIPSSVTTIGEYAFYGCSSLANVTFSESVDSMSIERYAFRDCSSLTTITFPEGITYIANNAFSGTGLTSITIPGSVKTFNGFSGCENLKSVTLAEGVECIADDAFHNYNDYSIESISIPNTVTYIGDNAFSNCSGLTSITLPDSLKCINDYAFSGCSGLTSVTLPDGLKCISNGGFLGCSSLKSINIPESVDSIGSSALGYCSNLTAITLPSNIKSIGEGTLRGCSSLTSINIPEGVKSIGASAFEGCGRLSKLSLPASLKEIGTYAFYDCGSLSKITIPEGVSVISRSTFSDCSSLVSISLPQSLNQIGEFVFSRCVSLKAIDIPENITSIGEGAFNECEDLASINIPQGVTVINESTFSGCVSLKSITIPAGVTSIESEAFYECENLTDLVFLGNEVTYVGAMALRDCDALKAVHVPTGAYANYTDLLSLYEPNVVEDVVIIGTTGYATACSRTSALDFSSAEIEAYVASVTEDGTSVALHKTHTTAVGEGFVVKGAEGSYLIPTASSETPANQVNTLVGTTEDATLTSGGDSTFYYMAALTSGNVGFTKLESGSVVIPAGQAYLSAAVSVAELEFVVGEDLTAIKNVQLADEAKGNGTWHTLSGLTVTKPTKGLYIHNGKKVYVR